MQIRGRASLREADAHEAVVEVVVVGRPRRAPVLQPLQHDEGGVENRHRHHEQRPGQCDRGGRLQHALHGDQREQKSKRERPRVAHEDLRGVVVVAEEAERGAADDGGQHGRISATERDGEQRKRPRGDRHDPCRERIHAVDQVHEIGENRHPEERQRNRRPADVVIAEERQRHMLDPQIPAEYRDQRHDRDRQELRARAEPADVIVETHDGHETRAQQHPCIRAVDVDPYRRRGEDRDHDRHPADARNRPVDARPVAAIVDAPIRGASLATSGVRTSTSAAAVRKAHGIPSSTSPRMESPGGSLRRTPPESPIAREAPDTGASIALPWTPQPPSPRPLPCSTIGSARGRLVSGSSDSDTPAFHSPSCSLTRAFR